MQTVWRSLQAIQDFAGADIDAAIVAEEAAALLTDFDRRVRHFDIASTDQATGCLAGATSDDEAAAEASKEY